MDVRTESSGQSPEAVRSAQPRADVGIVVTGLQTDTCGVLVETAEEFCHP